MFLKIVSENVVSKSSSEPCYEVSFKDYYNFSIEKSIFDSYQKGDLYLSVSNNIFTFKDSKGKAVKTINA